MYVNRSCSEGGGASFGITALNASSTVGASIRVKVWVDSKRVFFQTYTVGANNDIFITSIGGVPEDAYFRIKIVFRDDLGAHRTVGRFSKLTNCDEEITPTTTSTIPVITTTTLPILEPTDPVDEELEEFEDPLTGEEGNDFFVWDDFDEDLYLSLIHI